MAEVAKLPLETMNEVLNVLGGLPYAQVAEIIAKVRRDTTVETVPEQIPQSEPKEESE